ncbi:MAG: hypothetical protein ACRDL7_00020 [Gaiellaceae bacterium]
MAGGGGNAKDKANSVLIDEHGVFNGYANAASLDIRESIREIFVRVNITQIPPAPLENCISMSGSLM